MRQQPGCRTRRGFSLVEILVVLACVAILGTIAVPSMINARIGAASARVANEMRTLRTAILSYKTDHGTFPRNTAGHVFDDVTEYVGPGRDIGLCQTPAGGPTFDEAGNPSPKGRAFGVTTPIAYLSAIPIDPMPPWEPGCSRRARHYAHHDLATMRSLWDAGFNHGGPVALGLSGFWSVGACRSESYASTCPPPADFLSVVPATNWGRFESEFGGFALWSPGPGPRTTTSGYWLPYDPTNGTQSRGAIYVTEKFSEPTWTRMATMP